MKDKMLWLFAIISSAFASICCIGPILLAGVGIGGLGLAAGLTKYRSLFLLLTAIFLGFALYFAYRKRQVTCKDGSCEFRSASKTMKRTLWIITIAAIGVATFPNWSPFMSKGQSATVSSLAKKTVFTVSGMTCFTCSSDIEKSLKQVASVESASVSFGEGEAVVYTESSQVSIKELITAIESAGEYQAEIKQHR